MEATRITLAHGAGGSQTSDLIGQIFAAHFFNQDFTADDAAVLSGVDGDIAFSTDGYIVTPFTFPGGDIGKLAVCGTVNDLACMGAKPLYLTCSFVLEEGFLTKDLERIASTMERTAAQAGVRIVAGDTKVAGKGQVDQIFLTTAGIGVRSEGVHPSGSSAVPGDAVLVTGDIGRHGCAILLAREELGIEAEIQSDCAPLWETVEAMFGVTNEIHVIRDATRGGVGTVLYEVAKQSGVGIRLESERVPVDPSVRGVCGLLGLDPLYLANEGTMVVIAPNEYAQDLLLTLRSGRYSAGAALIGEVTDEMPGRVSMRTRIGAEVILPRPGGELLPRIC